MSPSRGFGIDVDTPPTAGLKRALYNNGLLHASLAGKLNVDLDTRHEVLQEWQAQLKLVLAMVCPPFILGSGVGLLASSLCLSTKAVGRLLRATVG